MIVCELLLDKRHPGSLEIIPELVVILLLAVRTLLEGRADVTGGVVCLPTITLSITDDARDMGKAGASAT